MTLQNKKSLLIPCLVLFLSACGGTTQVGTDGNGGTSGSTPGGTTQRTVRFGSFASTGDFNDGQIAAAPVNLQPGQSSTLRLDIINQDGARVTDATDIFFSSPCLISGLSEVTMDGNNAAVVTNGTGTVMVNYTARGCTGADTVTARSSIDGVSLNATVTLQTQQAPLGSIQFESTSRNIIGIQGSGAIPEQATLTFLVTDATGGPASNQPVTFSTNTAVGGIALSDMQDTSDVSGRVSTTVSSGTIATTVRVTATVSGAGATPSAVSSGLSITTGVPDNDSVSLSATNLNIEGLDFDGATTSVTVRSADRFNNPVPDGTAFNFTSEGGVIQGSCLTSSGACSVNLTSQNPKPANGRVTILATAIGEENFDDSNGNGRFDQGETIDDLSEAFRDDNGDSTRDAGEPFIDFNGDEDFNAPNGKFDGLLCDGSNACDASSIIVSELLEIVFSGSDFEGTPDSDCGFGSTEEEPERGCININSNSAISLNAAGGSATSVTVTIGDENGGVPPVGTTIEASTTQGTIVTQANFTQASTSDKGAASYKFSVEPSDDNAGGNGTFTVVVTTPNRMISSRSVNVTQAAMSTSSNNALTQTN